MTPRREDARLLRGLGRFLADIRLADEAHCAFARSPHAHAEIARIDTRAALRMPGVLAVLTGADARADGVHPILSEFGPGAIYPGASDGFRPGRAVLAADRVRYVGEPVALVVAETVLQARDAAEAVEIEWHPLPALVTIERALAGPTLWPEAPRNVAFEFELGDRAATERAFRAARHVVRVEVANQRVAVLPIEQRGAIGAYDAGNAQYTLYSSTQSPYRIRSQLANGVLRVPLRDVRVIAPDIGGAFGLKMALYPEDAAVLWAARRVGRPVKWVPERTESFLSDDQARDQSAVGELALDAGGRILALRAEMHWNVGAYVASVGAVPQIFGPPLATGAYAIGAAHVRAAAVLTNLAPTGGYRGVGRPEASYLIERLIDAAARALAVDPAELRRRNVISGFPYRTALDLEIDSGDFPRVLARVLERGAWADRVARKAEAAARGRLLGVGVTTHIETASFFNDRVELRLEPDGGVTVLTGSVSTGQGHETVIAQLVESRLGVPQPKVRVVQGDTEKISFGRGSYGSRTMTVIGSALDRASVALIDELKPLAATIMEAAGEDIEFASGVFAVAGTDRRIAIADLAKHCYDGLGPLGDHVLAPCATGVYNSRAATFPNGSVVCEVEIDAETGELAIVRWIGIDDAGVEINPALVQGQLHGGLAQGLGQALMEGIRHDSSGQLLTGSLMDYAIPRAADLPSFDLESAPTPCTTNPLGVKGVGEVGCVSAPPALVCAVLDALAPLGVTRIEMPVTSEVIWLAISASRAAS